SVTHERLKSRTGKLMPTVIAEPISGEREEEMHKAARNEEDELMKAINDHAGCSGAELARHLGWISRKGEPQRFKVSRIVKDLKRHKLVNETRAGAYTHRERKEDHQPAMTTGQNSEKSAPHRSAPLHHPFLGKRCKNGACTKVTAPLHRSVQNAKRSKHL